MFKKILQIHPNFKISEDLTMKIVFNRQTVSDAVAPLMCAVSGKSTLTAAEGILIEANADGSCVMTTFDLEKGMRIQMEAEVEDQIEAYIDGKIEELPFLNQQEYMMLYLNI